MKVLFDLLTIVLFFIVYKMYDMYAAVAIAMACYTLQIMVTLLRGRTVDKIQWFTLSLILLLGGMTFFFHNELFFKFKPTAVYWLFAIVFFSSHFIGTRKPIIERMVSQQIHLPPKVWHRLNLSWAFFFTLMGALNLFVLYNFDTDTWVNFKLFGIMGLTLVFIMAQVLYMSRHQSEENQDKLDA